MKINILRLLVVMLACASAFVVLVNVHAEKHSGPASTIIMPVQPVQTPAASQEKTTEQVQKNIKVLTGLPQSQLIPVMNFMATSLGRRCNYCHVNNNGQWDYASDEKQEKNTAREMIKLVLDVNKNSFKGNTEVSCFTCHRGRNSPQAIPSLPLPAPSPQGGNQGGPRPGGAAGSGQPAGQSQAQASPSPAPALPSADDIFNKYIAAIGGQAAIDKLASRAAKGNLVQANGNSLQFEFFQSGPDKFYLLVTTPQGNFERGFNGQVGWEKTARGVREVTGGELANLKATNALFSLIKLKEQFARPPRVRRDKIADRDVYVLTGQMADGKRLLLFFDAASGLLVRRITVLSTMIGNIPEQVDLEDYRDVDGIKFPFTARSSTIEAGNPTSTRTYTEMKLNTAVDDSKFKMPPATAATNP